MGKTCGTCKFWGEGVAQGDDPPDCDYRPCGAVIHDKRGHARAEKDDVETYLEDYCPEHEYAETRAEIAAIRKHKAIVHDGSGYYAALKTKDDFGCVLHQPKEQPHE